MISCYPGIDNTAEYARGRRAFANGALRKEPPYPHGSMETFRWQFGWDDAQDDDRIYREVGQYFAIPRSQRG